MCKKRLNNVNLLHIKLHLKQYNFNRAKKSTYNKFISNEIVAIIILLDVENSIKLINRDVLVQFIYRDDKLTFINISY